MLNTNGHQNSHCAFAEQLAGYLYDEVAGADKAAFESHLQGCGDCAAELANFSALRSSIIEWRATDFDSLPTPAFVLPTTGETVRAKRPLFETIRAFFNFSAAQTAFAAMTILLLTGGLFWFFSNQAQNRNSVSLEIAENEKPNLENSRLPLPVPTIEKSLEKNSSDESMNDNHAAQNSSGSGKDSAGKNNSAATKQAVASLVPVVQRGANRQAPTNGANPRVRTPAKNTRPPVDEDDDDDDNSLRLSDLFDEVGMNAPPDQEDHPNDK